MVDSTHDDHFRDWGAFHLAYEELIRAAFRSLPFVDPDDVDDLTQGFLVKQMGRDLIHNRPAITGRFRSWLYATVRNYAADHGRRRRTEGARLAALAPHLPSEAVSPDEADPFGGDLDFALGVLNATLRQVREHWEAQGKPEVWAIFDELVLAPLDPARVPRSRDELRRLYPDRAPNLDNCCTSVKRVIRRVLPAMFPPGTTDHRAPEDRFREWLEILRRSRAGLCGQLRLAFETDRPWDDGSALDESVAFARGGGTGPTQPADSADSAEMRAAENRVLIGIWLALPLRYYLDPRRVDPRWLRGPGSGPTLGGLLDSPATDPAARARELLLLEGVKTFAKRVHHAIRPGPDGIADEPSDRARRAHSMTPEVAQVLYNLAWSLALTRHGRLIVSLDARQLTGNLDWLLDQSWLHDRLRPVFRSARLQIAT